MSAAFLAGVEEEIMAGVATDPVALGAVRYAGLAATAAEGRHAGPDRASHLFAIMNILPVFAPVVFRRDSKQDARKAATRTQGTRNEHAL